MPRKFSLQTTLRQRPTRISIGSHPYRRVALSIVRKKRESVNLVDYSQPIGVLGEGHSFFAERDFPARLVGRETKKEQSSCERLLPSSDIATCNVWSDVGSPRKYRPPRIGDIPRGSAVESSPTNSPTTKGTSDAEQLSTDAPGPSKVLSSPEYIQEVRKDSALYLEEGEGTLKTATQATTDVLRRQSSGYVSRRDSFEDNRRNSATGSDTQQQEKERHKSKPITLGALIKDLAGRKEENIEENIENIEASTDTAKGMPTTEIHRKVSSSSGLDMPNVDEAKEVVRNKTLPRQRSFQTQEINDGLTTRLSEIQVTSIFRNPNIYLPCNNDKNAPSDEVDTIQRVVDTTIDHSASGNSN